MKETVVISKIVGIMVNEDLSAKEAIDILDKAKNVFLKRSFHVNSEKKAD